MICLSYSNSTAVLAIIVDLPGLRLGYPSSRAPCLAWAWAPTGTVMITDHCHRQERFIIGCADQQRLVAHRHHNLQWYNKPLHRHHPSIASIPPVLGRYTLRERTHLYTLGSRAPGATGPQEETSSRFSFTWGWMCPASAPGIGWRRSRTSWLLIQILWSMGSVVSWVASLCPCGRPRRTVAQPCAIGLIFLLEQIRRMRAYKLSDEVMASLVRHGILPEGWPDPKRIFNISIQDYDTR